MIKVAFAQEVESLPELEKLSRDELIDLLMKPGRISDEQFPGSGPNYRYYKKPSDKIDIERTLRLEGRELQIQMSKLDHVPTSALWFGVDVPVDAARRVAEALLREGVELKYFGPFPREGAKANRIEIGTDTGLGGDAVMTRGDAAATGKRAGAGASARLKPRLADALPDRSPRGGGRASVENQPRARSR